MFDTFLKMDQFTKGVAFIESSDQITNLGRYWPKTGLFILNYLFVVYFLKYINNIYQIFV